MKPHKLDLANRLEALCSHPDAQATDQQFGERRVDHALRSEPLLQPDSGAEDTAIDPDVFTKNDNVGIILRARVSAKLTASTSVTSAM